MNAALPATTRAHTTRVARVTREALSPVVMATLTPLLVAIHTNPTLGGVGWAALAALFGALIPFTIILHARQRGRVTDHHISNRHQRRNPLLQGVASATAGLLLFIALDAPPPMIGIVAVNGALLAVVTAVNTFWKLSIHAAFAAATATVSTTLFGISAAPAFLGVALVCWSRIHLGDHTASQVALGTISGVTIATAIYPPIA